MFQVLPIFTVIGVLFAAPAIAGGAVLYDQTANPIPDGLNSQEYPDNSTFTNQLADDFTVPAGQTWTITEIDVVGEGNAVLPVNVHFYTDLNALPGMRLFFHPQIAAGNGPDYTIPLSGVPPLGPGTYWASVQSYGPASAGGPGEWFWGERSSVSGHIPAWRNPGNGFGATGCTSWSPKSSCVPQDQDQLFKLEGTAVVATGQRAAALKKCTKTAKKKDWTKKRLRKCRKKAMRLSI